MARVFTITEGLENMGALRTGGQGSVYKARRTGTVITAVKLLPTPLFSEDPSDKHFRDFQNEVEKLKKVNLEPNPHVVKILSSGVSDTGNFPFIEMEFIEGPDLEELLQPPHDPLFSLKEVSKVAEQLSSALAHCHRVGVKHGDVKSNNVKYNLHTANYVLLDFGLAVLSEEERRTSLRQAGAVEFMAPEQSEGRLLFQSDVYSFGVILYELLTGSVPFPLGDKGESGRNRVMVAHLEEKVGDVAEKRRAALPEGWSAEKKEQEGAVPQWLAGLVHRCLEKKPELRFPDGMALHDYVVRQTTQSDRKSEAAHQQVLQLQQQNDELKKTAIKNAEEIAWLKQKVAAKEAELKLLNDQQYTKPAARTGVSKASFLALLLITIGLGALAAYELVFNKQDETDIANKKADTTITAAPPETKPTTPREIKKSNNIGVITDTVKQKKKDNTVLASNNENKQLNEEQAASDAAAEKQINDTNPQKEVTDTNTAQTSDLGKYKVVSKAYFHNEPDESTRRNAFIVHWNNAVLTALDEKNDFIYVVYTNSNGQTSKGWLRKKDLKPAGE